MENEDVININFGDVGLYLHRSAEDIRIARILLDILEGELCKAQGCVETLSPTPSQAKQPESPPEGKGEVLVPIPQEHTGFKNELIPKFEYDKKAEKNYDNLFFFELEDGRVMLSYSNGRLYTTKAAVMQLPFPVPRGYEPLKELTTNNRVAVRTYRKYLAVQEEIVCPGKACPNVGDDCVLACEGTDTATEREEKLKKVAEVNAQRWQDTKPQKEMSTKTQKLREMVIKMAEETS